MAVPQFLFDANAISADVHPAFDAAARHESCRHEKRASPISRL